MSREATLAACPESEHRRMAAVRSANSLRTKYDPPPVPFRDCDWSCVSDNYDASYEDGQWVTNERVGYGRTEYAAIQDWLINNGVIEE